MISFNRALRARMGPRKAEGGGTALAALRLPFGAPQRQLGIFPGIP